ncbi:MAG TPA: HAD-IA family hydrolase [Methylocystis sp.]|nr:HAD-IA family hydrolase [Methylocystis sp.]
MQSLAPTIVFDLDGTLADTAPDLIGTLNVLLERESLPPQTLDQARALVGGGARALLERGFRIAGEPLSPGRAEALVADFLAHYATRIADETRLFPGATDALARLSEAGFRLAVCTNKPEGLARLLLERLAVAERFSAICGRDTFATSKPDGRTLIATIDLVGGDPAKAVMVGDSKTDVETARNAGAPVVAVDFGYSEPPVATFGPDRVISHFDELWDAAHALLERA